MNIQQNLNALLTMGAVAARTSDRYATNVEYRKLSKAEEAQETIHKALTQRNDEILGSGKTDNIVQEKEQESLEKIVDIDTKKAGLKGKEKDINKAVDTEIQRQKEERDYEEMLEAMAQDAENALGQEVKKANEEAFKSQVQYQTQVRAQRKLEDERRLQLKQDEMREVLAAAKKTYGGK